MLSHIPLFNSLHAMVPTSTDPPTHNPHTNTHTHTHTFSLGQPTLLNAVKINTVQKVTRKEKKG